MSWRRWKIGLVAALLSTAVDGIIVYLADPTVVANLKGHIVSISVGLTVILCKSFGMYIKQHPLEELTDNTEFIVKKDNNEILPKT